MTCWNLGTKGCIIFDWGDGKTRYNSHTPYGKAGPFCACCCRSMLVACLVSLIYTKFSENTSTPLPTTTTRRRWQRVAEADGLSHKKGHRFRQQQNSDDDKTPTKTTLTTRRRSQDANNNYKTPTMMTRRQQRQRRQDSDRNNLAIIDKILT